MKKEYLIPAIIIIAIVAIIGFITLSDLNPQSETIKIGDASFTLPEKYVVGNPNKMNDTTIENGNNKIYLSTCDNNVKDSEVDPYIKNLEKRNLTSKLTTLDVNGTTVYKVDIPKRDTTHYWFELDGKGYTIYTWDKVDGIDDVVKDLVGSAMSNK